MMDYSSGSTGVNEYENWETEVLRQMSFYGGRAFPDYLIVVPRSIKNMVAPNVEVL